jgi:ubiquinone/menaquinone biosynthesis C-methylase UbiE
MQLWLRKMNRFLDYLLPGVRKSEPPTRSSADYRLLSRESAERGPYDGWHNHGVTERQDAAYRKLIQQMYAGQPRQDLLTAAEAVRYTGMDDPLILEVGCGSGYYSEILSHLLDRSVRYVGLDYSAAMLELARKRYPEQTFVLADGTALPFTERTLDIVMNGVSLMHILSYETAITEARRVAAHWCIFHTIPILQNQQTTFLQKKVYGEAALEVIFNEAELHQILVQKGLVVRQVLESLPYDLKRVVGEPTVTKTYVCEVRNE